MKKKEKIRLNIVVYVSLALIACGLIGLTYDDWTQWFLLIPFGWGIIGFILGEIVNGRCDTYTTAYNAVSCTLMLANVATILVHRDTMFIVGRVLCCAGLTLLAIRAPKDVENEMQKKIEKLEKENSEIRKDFDRFILKSKME